MKQVRSRGQETLAGQPIHVVVNVGLHAADVMNDDDSGPGRRAGGRG